MFKKILIANRGEIANPFFAAGLGYLEEVIEPVQTRAKLIRALETCKNKRDSNPPRKHGNLPL